MRIIDYTNATFLYLSFQQGSCEHIVGWKHGKSMPMRDFFLGGKYS